jgi:hypothetical protein
LSLAPGGPQIFRFLNNAWDVDAALALVAQRKPDLMPVTKELANSAQFIEVDEAWANSHADLAIPVILVTLPEGSGCLIIDGWHRIAKALGEGKRTLPAHLLSEDDSEALRLSP